jgi:hypothetical protein
MFGIDQQVQQTADAYRSKPQMLQQKYAQNQQLIDLLALQKLKSDKEEASRQMALSMQGKPQTIADQRESQVLDMTKKEVIDEQAGVMQNKMKQMQDAQRKVLQAAGAPPMPGQSSPQPQQPPSAGLAGLPAPNIQGMAGGGIVAFDEGGTTGEEEARRVMEQRRQQPAPQPTQQAQGGMQAGLARLLGIDPEAIYQQRRTEAARDANYNAEERAAYARQADEKRAAYDNNKLNRMLLGMGGYSTNYGAIQGGGATAVNDEDRFMRERQSDERRLIDIGPAARMAGMKAGETAYGHGMTGLTSGVDAAARMAATSEAGANRAQAAKDALEGRLQIAQDAERGRADARVNLLHKTTLESVMRDPAYVAASKALEQANQMALGNDPKMITARDQKQLSLQTLTQQLYKLHRELQPGVAPVGNAPPVATPAPNVVPYNSLPK